MLALGAAIEVHRVMILEDLGEATAGFERVAQKYGRDGACLVATGPGSHSAPALPLTLIRLTS
jgi:hypothetical protein